MFKDSMYFIGLELGDRRFHLIILDQQGELVEDTCLPTTQASFQRKFSTLFPCRVALEVG